MTKPVFYQAKLVKVRTNVIEHVYGKEKAKHITLEERLPDNAKCDVCERNEWILLAKEAVSVRESGKQYIECLNCGYVTHL